MISVIVPIYNVEKYLNRCIKSILAQTFTDFKLILVDDGSPDNCGKICDDYAEKDSRIHVIHKENGGLSDARNAGLDWAYSNLDFQLLAFVDSDDLLHHDAFEILFETSNSTSADIVLGDFCGFSELNEIQAINKIITYSKKEIPKIEAWEHLLDNKHMVYGSVCGSLYKSSVFENIRFPVGRTFEDVAISYLLYANSKKTVYVDVPLYFYYTNPTGITHQFTEKNIRDSILASAERTEWFKQKLGHDSKIYYLSMRLHLRHAMSCYKICKNRNLKKYIIRSFNNIVNYKLLKRKDKALYKECRVFRLKTIIIALFGAKLKILF